MAFYARVYYIQLSTLPTFQMSRLRVHPGDDGDAERDREAQWRSLPPLLVMCFGSADNTSGPNRTRAGFVFLQLRCNCPTRRGHGFGRCNRHIAPQHHFRGCRYCIQCRGHCGVTQEVARQAALQMRRNWNRMRSTSLPQADAAFYTNRICCGSIRGTPQNCHCSCAGCHGPEPPPEAPVVSVEPPLHAS